MNMFVYLKGVMSTHMEHILKFMYHGEVNISQDELDSFLKLAEELSVEGLTTNKNEDQQQDEYSSHISDETYDSETLIQDLPQELISTNTESNTSNSDLM